MSWFLSQNSLLFLVVNVLQSKEFGIAEIMGSNPVQAWIFFRPYFHYCPSSAHYCEDHFHSRKISIRFSSWFVCWRVLTYFNNSMFRTKFFSWNFIGQTQTIDTFCKGSCSRLFENVDVGQFFFCFVLNFNMLLRKMLKLL